MRRDDQNQLQRVPNEIYGRTGALDPSDVTRYKPRLPTFPMVPLHPKRQALGFQYQCSEPGIKRKRPTWVPLPRFSKARRD